MNQLSKHESLKDLYDVGSKKSLGYLPIHTVTDIYNVPLEEVIEYAKTNGIPHLILDYPEECTIFTGSIFFYDEPMLQVILGKYSAALKRAGVPHHNCLDYIRYIAKFTVFEDRFPEAYLAIGKTFNNPLMQEE
jgi:hypothetical protein